MCIYVYVCVCILYIVYSFVCVCVFVCCAESDRVTKTQATQETYQSESGSEAPSPIRDFLNEFLNFMFYFQNINCCCCFFIDFVTKLLLYFVVYECCFFGVANLFTPRLTKIHLYILTKIECVCVLLCVRARERERDR